MECCALNVFLRVFTNVAPLYGEVLLTISLSARERFCAHAAHPFVTFDVCYVPHRLEKCMERMAEGMASMVRESQRRETTDALTFYGT